MQGAKLNMNILRLAIILLLIGCNSKNNEGVIAAKGNTPAKYVICGASETNCFVSARFRNLDSCEDHKKWSEMLCDSISHPEKMICENDKSNKIAFSYCTL